MHRILLLILLMIEPAVAWESGSGRVCEIVHQSENALLRITFDPAIEEYSLAISLTRSWAAGPIFALRFEGLQSNTITTDQHRITDGGATVVVTDSGFGNVLDGVEFNTTVTAILGEQEVTVLLDGAAQSLREFRRCSASVAI